MKNLREIEVEIRRLLSERMVAKKERRFEVNESMKSLFWAIDAPQMEIRAGETFWSAREKFLKFSELHESRLSYMIFNGVVLVSGLDEEFLNKQFDHMFM